MITAKHAQTIHCAFTVLKKMADEMEEDLVVLVKKPNATSIMWNYFGLEANKGGTPKPDKNPICRSCK